MWRRETCINISCQSIAMNLSVVLILPTEVSIIVNKFSANPNLLHLKFFPERSSARNLFWILFSRFSWWLRSHFAKNRFLSFHPTFYLEKNQTTKFLLNGLFGYVSSNFLDLSLISRDVLLYERNLELLTMFGVSKESFRPQLCPFHFTPFLKASFSWRRAPKDCFLHFVHIPLKEYIPNDSSTMLSWLKNLCILQSNPFVVNSFLLEFSPTLIILSIIIINSVKLNAC